MSLGVAIGAHHLHRLGHRLPKLNGHMSGKPIMLPARHVINIAPRASLLVVLIVVARATRPTPGLLG